MPTILSQIVKSVNGVSDGICDKKTLKPEFSDTNDTELGTGGRHYY